MIEWRWRTLLVLPGVVLLMSLALAQRQSSAPAPAPITVDYPEEGSIFPPEITPPTFLWRDPAKQAGLWRIEVTFGDGTAPIRAESKGERLRIGEIDPRAVSNTNELPKLTPEQAAAWVWKPDPETWEAIKRHSVSHPAAVTITGFAAADPSRVLSRGSVDIQTSKDLVGAPIFYRDVPLMPSELEKGVIKPLAPNAVPLIAWRLRDIGQTQSKVMMTGLHTCANCHSFSRDGKTMGMDLDGPRNDKGMYTLVPVKPEMTIGNQDVIEWSSFRGKLTGDIRIGFMSRVSPDGQYVVTTIKGPDSGAEKDSPANNYYVANFKDYRFLQVFYPTRGILAWYSRQTGHLEPLPGADDPRYVQTNAVWSPDGKYLVFLRAEAKDPYPPGRPVAARANDPNELPMRYDLYRIPFNGGKGGQPERVIGASENGMSNSFPKVSPNGRWIVFVESHNGLLMRPDGKLYIVPFEGGEARRLRANTPLMNSWHSFSPNGRWLVFSSKSRSPYTQMFLTHLDEEGNSSPAILIDNSTAANRAVNLPEFVNIPPGGMTKINVPAVEFYKVFDDAWDLAEKGDYKDAVEEWRKAVALGPRDAKARVNFGAALVRLGKPEDAIAQYREALTLDPGYAEAHNNLGIALASTGKVQEAIEQYEAALQGDPKNAEAHNNLGLALASTGKLDEAMLEYKKALEIDPNYSEVHNNLGLVLFSTGNVDEAITQYRAAVESNPKNAQARGNLGLALAGAGKLDEAVAQYEAALQADPNSAQAHANYGLALADMGKLEDALAHLGKALAIEPNNAQVHNTLGLVLASAGRPDEAIGHFQKALEIQPNYSEAHYNLGATLYYLKGNVPEAMAQWHQVLKADPNQIVVLNQMALILAASSNPAFRNGPEAVVLAERAARLSGGREPQILDTLAAAYAEAGRFAEAVDTARNARTLALQQGQQPLADALSARLGLYEAKTPLRVTQEPAAH